MILLILFLAADPFSGTWKLNLAKSKLTSPAPQSQVVRVEADSGGVRLREEVVSDKGERLTVTVKARFDGKDYPVAGSQFADTVAYRRADSRTIQGTVKKRARWCCSKLSSSRPMARR